MKINSLCPAKVITSEASVVDDDGFDKRSSLDPRSPAEG